MRISKTQAGVLRRMIGGENLRQGIYSYSSAWIYDGRGAHWIRASTVRALRKRQMIELVTPKSPYSIRHYRITETGRKALEEYDAKANQDSD